MASPRSIRIWGLGWHQQAVWGHEDRDSAATWHGDRDGTTTQHGDRAGTATQHGGIGIRVALPYSMGTGVALPCSAGTGLEHGDPPQEWHCHGTWGHGDIGMGLEPPRQHWGHGGHRGGTATQCGDMGTGMGPPHGRGEGGWHCQAAWGLGDRSGIATGRGGEGMEPPHTTGTNLEPTPPPPPTQRGVTGTGLYPTQTPPHTHTPPSGPVTGVGPNPSGPVTGVGRNLSLRRGITPGWGRGIPMGKGGGREGGGVDPRAGRMG